MNMITMIQHIMVTDCDTPGGADIDFVLREEFGFCFEGGMDTRGGSGIQYPR